VKIKDQIRFSVEVCKPEGKKQLKSLKVQISEKIPALYQIIFTLLEETTT
jgi:hypothetical protein